jgi:hypothetical protein
MDDEIQLISDDDHLAVIGDPASVERFLAAEGLPSRDLRLPRLRAVLGGTAAVAQAGSEIAANSGRWVKMTKESAQAVKKYGLMKNSTTGLSMGVVTKSGGRITRLVQFERGPWSAADQPGDSWWCRGDHGAACDAADHGRDHRLSRHDRREAR